MLCILHILPSQSAPFLPVATTSFSEDISSSIVFVRASDIRTPFILLSSIIKSFTVDLSNSKSLNDLLGMYQTNETGADSKLIKKTKYSRY